ncbi:hypothetical protein [Kitasatospora sp. MMS16-BH015]|uniref:hypothetical protein n=1 Tax=Kitasatospora sp. MMS16-BH015 TaxID=2018025 RepID=UPI00131A5010|nr:hypothetical protein [Kitasatospora sp. MMS16-BH015]
MAGGGGTQRSPQPPVNTPVDPPASPPASNPPAQSGPPQGCGGTGWGYITGVGSGQRLGLGSGGLAGGTPAVVGRNTSYGWLRSAPDPGGWYTIYPCNMSSPVLVQSMNDKTVGLYPDWSAMTRWKVETASTRGAVYLANYMGSTCLTDNGAGNTATMETCTPGNSAQEWYIP